MGGCLCLCVYDVSSSTQSQFQVPTSDKEAAEMETKHVYEVGYDCANCRLCTSSMYM